MKHIHTLIIVLLIIVLTSCDNDLIVDTSPRGDFDLFFEYLEHDYSYRDFYSFSMRELKQKYLPDIEASNTTETLAEIIIKVENDLQDPHFYFRDNEPYDLVSNISVWERENIEEISPRLDNIINIIQDTYFYTSGTVNSDSSIGYLHIKKFNFDVGGTSSLGIEDGVKEIDNILKELIDLGVTSMIVDIRSDAGGSNYVPRYIAQRFSDKKAVYMIEYYPEGRTFIKKEWTVKPEGTGFRTGKVALLSNGLTASGGEMFVLAMLQRDNVFHIGSNTRGATGNIVTKDLSNGWNLTMTNSRTEMPDGTQYFKVGIKPGEEIINDVDDLSGNDKLIDKAIEELTKPMN